MTPEELYGGDPEAWRLRYVDVINGQRLHFTDWLGSKKAAERKAVEIKNRGGVVYAITQYRKVD